MGNPSQSYGASLAIWDHTVLPVTRHKWTRPAITPANQAGTRFTYPGRMEGWVHLGSLIAARPRIEPTTAWSQVRRPNRYATESPFVRGLRACAVTDWPHFGRTESRMFAWVHKTFSHCMRYSCVTLPRASVIYSQQLQAVPCQSEAAAGIPKTVEFYIIWIALLSYI